MHRRNYLAGLAGCLPITAGCINVVAPTNGLKTETVQLRHLHQLHPRSLSYSGEKGSRLSSISTRDAANRLDLDQQDKKGRAQILSPSTHVERATTFVRETDFDTEALLLLTSSVGHACHAFETESMRLEGETIRGRVVINQLDLREECPNSIASVAMQTRAVLLSAIIRVHVGQSEPTAAVIEVDPVTGEQETWQTKIESRGFGGGEFPRMPENFSRVPTGTYRDTPLGPSWEPTEPPFKRLEVGESIDLDYPSQKPHSIEIWNSADERQSIELALRSFDSQELVFYDRRTYPTTGLLRVDIYEPEPYLLGIRCQAGESVRLRIPYSVFDCNGSSTNVRVRQSGEIRAGLVSLLQHCPEVPPDPD